MKLEFAPCTVSLPPFRPRLADFIDLARRNPDERHAKRPIQFLDWVVEGGVRLLGEGREAKTLGPVFRPIGRPLPLQNQAENVGSCQLIAFHALTLRAPSEGSAAGRCDLRFRQPA